MLETIITAAVTALFVAPLAPLVWNHLKRFHIRFQNRFDAPVRVKPPTPILDRFHERKELERKELERKELERKEPAEVAFTPGHFLVGYDPVNRAFKLRVGKPSSARHCGPDPDLVIPAPKPRTLADFGYSEDDEDSVYLGFSVRELKQLLVGEADSTVLARIWEAPDQVSYAVGRTEIERIWRSLSDVFSRFDQIKKEAGGVGDEVEDKTEPAPSEDKSN